MLEKIKPFICKNKYTRREDPKKNIILHLIFLFFTIFLYFPLKYSWTKFFFPKDPYIYLPSVLLYYLLFFSIFQGNSKINLFYLGLYITHMTFYYFIPAITLNLKQPRLNILPQILLLIVWGGIDGILTTCEYSHLKSKERPILFLIISLIPLLILKSISLILIKIR